MSQTSQGKGIACSACGGRFPLGTLAGGARCPFCGVTIDLTGATIASARQYRDDVFAAMRGVDAERAQVDAWSRWSDSGPGGMSWGTKTLLVTAAMMTFPALAMVPAALLSLGHVEVPYAARGWLNTATSLCTSLPIILMMFGVGTWHLRQGSGRSKRAVASELGPPSKVACPHCGAPNQLAVGQHVQTCAFCDGALMPSRTVMIAGLDAARQARRRAALERYRAERAGRLGVARYTANSKRLLPLMYLLFLAPMLFGVCALPLQAAEHLSLATLLWSGAAALFIFSLLAGLAIFLLGRRQVIRRQRAAAMRDLARQFNGQHSDQITDLVSWLDRHWAGPYEARFVGAGPRFSTVAFNAWGYSAAIALNPEEPAGQTYMRTPAYVRLMLAAWIPSRTDGGPPPTLDARARETMQWLRDAGFFVTCEEAGLLAMAQPHVVQHLLRYPRAAHQLAPVIGHLAKLAQEIGATPLGSPP